MLIGVKYGVIMFKSLRWKYRMFRFDMRWSNVDKPYLVDGYLKDMASLIDGIPDTEITNLYNKYTYIPIITKNIVDWLSNCEGYILAITEGRFRNPMIDGVRQVTLHDYLISDDGYRVSYVSALRAVMSSLVELDTAIRRAPYEASRNHYYRQLTEYFTTGIALCNTVLEEKRSG